MALPLLTSSLCLCSVPLPDGPKSRALFEWAVPKVPAAAATSNPFVSDKLARKILDFYWQKTILELKNPLFLTNWLKILFC